MGKGSEYYKEKEMKDKLTLQRLEQELPQVAKDYIHEKDEGDMQISTRVAYARDLLSFFRFMVASNPMYKDKKTSDFSYEDLQLITPQDINEYKADIARFKSRSAKGNSSAGIARKLAPLKGLYLYCNRYQYVTNNPLNVVARPSGKNRDKTILRMDNDEVSSLKNVVLAAGEGAFSSKQSKFCSKTQQRDYAIISVFLGTGIRVSELVGLDYRDVNFTKKSLLIVRKGGGQDIVYFNDEVKEALLDYINGERLHVISKVLPGEEDALFFSGKYRRISVDAVENVVKKYAKSAVPDKIISCHKLRSTYGSRLLNVTGDVALTASVLGHSSPATTMKFYSEVDQLRKKDAGNANVYDESMKFVSKHYTEPDE